MPIVLTNCPTHGPQMSASGRCEECRTENLRAIYDSTLLPASEARNELIWNLIMKVRDRG